MARILIAGAGGSVGKLFAERLARPGATLEPAFPGPPEVVSLPHAELDVTQRGQVEAALERHRPEIVINAAGRNQVDACEAAPWEAFLVHRDAAEHVARLCSARGALPVYVGTDLVFDGTRPIPYAEEDPPNPLSIYGDSKLAGELMTMKHARRHLIVRTGWLYALPGRHFLSPFEGAVEDGEILFGYDDHVAQPTHAEDFADAVLHLLRTGREGRFHAAAAGRATQFAAQKLLLELMGEVAVDLRPLTRALGGRHAMRPRFSVLDVSKLAAAGFPMPRWEDRLKPYASSCRLRKNPDSRTASR